VYHLLSKVVNLWAQNSHSLLRLIACQASITLESTTFVSIFWHFGHFIFYILSKNKPKTHIVFTNFTKQYNYYFTVNINLKSIITNTRLYLFWYQKPLIIISQIFQKSSKPNHIFTTYRLPKSHRTFLFHKILSIFKNYSHKRQIIIKGYPMT